MSLRVTLLVLALGTPVTALADANATAVFAGGCFWCMEPPFDALDGVLETTSGYTGGHTTSPTYKQVTGGDTGHYESVQVTYDPSRVSYEQLLAVYWVNVDPFDATGQFCDKGASYRTAIFVAGDEERALAEASKASHEANFGRDVVTPILPAGAFYPAEEYHQDYYEKNPLRYKYYRYGCRRDQRLEEVWGD
jgi:peptide-methionine (S)-S-oxide reductase